jgi:hypothetical protein
VTFTLRQISLKGARSRWCAGSGANAPAGSTGADTCELWHRVATPVLPRKQAGHSRLFAMLIRHSHGALCEPKADELLTAADETLRL